MEGAAADAAGAARCGSAAGPVWATDEDTSAGRVGGADVEVMGADRALTALDRDGGPDVGAEECVGVVVDAVEGSDAAAAPGKRCLVRLRRAPAGTGGGGATGPRERECSMASTMRGARP